MSYLPDPITPATPDLQDVTDAGNTTADPINVVVGSDASTQDADNFTVTDGTSTATMAATYNKVENSGTSAFVQLNDDGTIDFATGGLLRSMGASNILVPGTALLSGTGVATSFNITIAAGYTNAIVQSLNNVATVQSSSITGTTLTVRMTTPPPGGVNNISLFYILN